MRSKRAVSACGGAMLVACMASTVPGSWARRAARFLLPALLQTSHSTGLGACGAVHGICTPWCSTGPPAHPLTGFDVRGAVRRIWLGQRDAQLLLMGRDAGSAAAIKQILFHAQMYDNKLGKQTYVPK